MVVMSIEAYERKLFKDEVHFKLKEAELEAKSTDKRYTHEEVFSKLRATLRLTGHKINRCSIFATPVLLFSFFTRHS